jgi:hypothetical protein
LQKLQQLLLGPLQELSSILHPDIRQKQLECVLTVLHSVGETLHQGWPTVLSVIGAVTNDQGCVVAANVSYHNAHSAHSSEAMIRIAFQSLQLVITDFLPIMSCSCLQVCVEVAARFGSQNQELNISLTAVGLLVGLS